MLDNLSPMSNTHLSNFRLEGEFVNIHKLIIETIEFYASQIDQKELKIVLTSDEILDLKANKSVINFILRNLLFNAIKYSDIGGAIVINYKLFNNSFELSIKDSGIGMSSYKISQILENKSNLILDETNIENDSEIGLNLSNQFIKQNNGKLKIESILGKGSKIVATIPLKI